VISWKNNNFLEKNIFVLEDVRSTIKCLKRIRDISEEIDIKMNPIDESYTLLSKYNIIVSQEKLKQMKD
jgi:hypothetical protein